MLKELILNKIKKHELGRYFYSQYGAKKYYVNCLFRTNKYKLIDEELNRIIDDFVIKEKQSDLNYINLLKIDMIKARYKYGCDFDEYFLYNFERLSDIGRASFITEGIRHNYYELLNRKENNIIYDNKFETYKLYGKYYKRDLMRVSEETDYSNFIKFIDKHPRFIVKPIDSSCGQGVILYDATLYNYPKEIFNTLIGSGDVVIEELINQTDKMALLHPNSVNTVRFTTIWGGGVWLMNPFIRWGRNNSVFDNASSGGVFACVDLATGIVNTCGVDKYGHRYVSHPDTNVPIVGFQIPKWSEAIELVKELANVLPSSRCIGWDLALTHNGWVMVEGNSGSQFIGQQIPDQIGKRVLFEKKMHEALNNALEF
jgi:hypothetical protein